MNDPSKTALIIACVVAASLLLLSGGGMATETMIGGMMGSGTMGGISWMWLPTVLVVAIGVVMFWALFKDK